MKAEEEEGKKKKERCPWTILPSRLKRDDYMAASVVQAVATATTLRTMSHFIVLNNSRSEEMFFFLVLYENVFSSHLSVVYWTLLCFLPDKTHNLC